MFLIQRISIRLRFYLVLGTVSLSLVVLGVWGWVSGEQLRQDTTALFNASNAAATQIAALRESLGRVRRWESAAIAIGNSNAEQVDTLITRWRQEVARARDTAAALRQTHADDATIAPLLDNQRQQLQAYATLMEPTLTQLQAGVTDSISALVTAAKADTLFAGLEAQTAQLVTALTAQEAQAREQMAAQASAASLLRLGLVVATLLLYVPLMWLTLRSVCQPLDRAVAIASRIAGGDLSQSIAVTGQDETAQLLQAIASMQTALGGVVGDVREAAESIRLASAEVASGNLDLSNRTEQTASDLQRSASLVRALTQTVQHSAASASRANQLAASAADVAAQGGTVVAQVVDTMQGINQSSHKISSIIAVIDTIAFQTNILALNAAVEAARAGEQGRGFAVVASEVRNLATRSAQAAREIKGLISDSVHGVEAGSQLVGTAGQTMGSIVASVQRVTEAIAEISSAAAEQSTGMDHINSTLGALDQMTQQNAALVEQSAAAAESLRGHAEKLTQMVGTFRLAPSSSLSLLPS